MHPLEKDGKQLVPINVLGKQRALGGRILLVASVILRTEKDE
jgi:hypothetical protein